MASIIEIGEPVNDGERIVLKRLRDDLPDEWAVVSNFEVPAGRRAFECDAVAFSPAGWAYLIEIKALVGQIEGNDREWAMPPLTGEEPYYIQNPIHMLRTKVKKLASMLKDHNALLVDLRLYPVIVVVSDIEPHLSGRYASDVVLDRAVCEFVMKDPRPAGHASVSPDLLKDAVDAITADAQPISPSGQINDWTLEALVDATDAWELWSARNNRMGAHGPVGRLKRFFLDALATGNEREKQELLARRDLDALIRLAGSDGAVPILSTVEQTEDSIAIVTQWPSGPTLAAYLEKERLDPDDARDLVEALLTALASVHSVGIVHRALTPNCAHVLPSGRVVLTDFDFARLPGKPSITQYLPEAWAGRYASPELGQSPANASSMSDVWSAARIAIDILSATDERTIDWDRVPKSWREPLQSALSPNPDDRPPNAQVLLQQLRSGSDTAPALREGFQPNDVLAGRWVVRSRAHSGGLADVYKVNDTELSVDYAAKFLQHKYGKAEEINVREEYKRVEGVPPHRNVALPVFIERLSTYQRGDTHYEIQTRFLLTPWIEGESLRAELSLEPLPLERAADVTAKLADALTHLHEHGLMHRDVKPANVIMNNEGEPVLVDFNIAARIDEASDTTVGTPDYMPPDLSITGWTEASDTYMLGITACEMLAGRMLGRNGVSKWISQAPVAPQVREVLEKATAPSGPRFDKPEALARAFGEAADQSAGRASPTTDPPVRIPTNSNHNPYRDEINRLFSQSRDSNAGTRGLDEFGRWTYTPTRIDNELRDAILRGHHRLVLITGNAGDGKTAFIQMIEHELEQLGAERTPRREGNGAVLERQGQRFETNWDGSQDEGEDPNDVVLEEFFGPYAGDDPKPSESETRLIAVNEGRLLDFIADETRRTRFPALSRALGRVLQSETPPNAEWILVVNLNLRALTLPAESGENIVAASLERFADGRLWEACETCRVKDHCYARANASLLRHGVLGPRARERVRQTLDVVRLRRRMHITMRDLRSALAFLVAGNRSCEEIAALVDHDAESALLAGHLPQALFGAAPEVADSGDPSATRDRLLAAVARLDVGRTADPAEDSRLWALGAKALPAAPEGVPAGNRRLLDRLRTAAREQTTAPQHPSVSFVHGSLRRTQFIEREGTSWIRMFPYDRLAAFEELLRGTDEAARDEIVRAVSYSEGLFNELFEGELAVSLAAEGDGPDRSYVKHPAAAFDLVVHDENAAAHYVEYAPDRLLLRFTGDHRIALEVDLDLFETLGRIRDGFVPSREELRGTWLNLRVFKDQLAAVPTDSLLLSRDDNQFHEIRRDAEGNALSLAPAS